MNSGRGEGGRECDSPVQGPLHGGPLYNLPLQSVCLLRSHIKTKTLYSVV